MTHHDISNTHYLDFDCNQMFVHKFQVTYYRKESGMILIIIEDVCAEILAFYRFKRALNLIMSGTQPVTLVILDITCTLIKLYKTLNNIKWHMI